MKICVPDKNGGRTSWAFLRIRQANEAQGLINIFNCLFLEGRERRSKEIEMKEKVKTQYLQLYMFYFAINSRTFKNRIF